MSDELADVATACMAASSAWSLGRISSFLRDKAVQGLDLYPDELPTELHCGYACGGEHRRGSAERGAFLMRGRELPKHFGKW